MSSRMICRMRFSIGEQDARQDACSGSEHWMTFCRAPVVRTVPHPDSFRGANPTDKASCKSSAKSLNLDCDSQFVSGRRVKTLFS